MANQRAVKKFDPYRNFKFKVSIEGNIVAGLNKMSTLKKNTEGIDWRRGDNSNLKSLPGRTTYEPITLERGLTESKMFEDWANLFHKYEGSVIDKDNFRRNIQIHVCDMNGEPKTTYNIIDCWVSEFQAVPDMDVSQNGVVIQTIKLENEGFERAYTKQPLDELAQRIETVSDWNDLVLHKSVIEHLKAIKNTIAQKFKVYEEFGFGAKMPHDRGMLALFSGPSGTGKTIAAKFLASKLGCDLYRIDLSKVINKYIGETEKNLKRIFESAKGANVLLFFAEADALFGKRTQISDSHDRYANSGASYLLQKLEEHDGLVVLATNRRKNIDEAFLRRFNFIIEFPKPSE